MYGALVLLLLVAEEYSTVPPDNETTTGIHHLVARVSPTDVSLFLATMHPLVATAQAVIIALKCAPF